MNWTAYEDTATEGMIGSEGGTILRDEELIADTITARITLERDCKFAPYAITCGVYDLLVHTRFFADEPTAIHNYDAMKPSLARIVALSDAGQSAELDAEVVRFTEAYP